MCVCVCSCVLIQKEERVLMTVMKNSETEPGGYLTHHIVQYPYFKFEKTESITIKGFIQSDATSQG